MKKLGFVRNRSNKWGVFETWKVVIGTFKVVGGTRVIVVEFCWKFVYNNNHVCGWSVNCKNGSLIFILYYVIINHNFVLISKTNYFCWCQITFKWVAAIILNSSWELNFKQQKRKKCWILWDWLRRIRQGF